MTKRQLRKAAKKSILEGKSKQETFENLKISSKISNEELAKIIQITPSLEAREKFKTLNGILIGTLLITVLFKMLAGIPIVIENGIKWIPVLFLLPIINILLLIGVATYSPNAHKLVGIFTIIGLFRGMGNIIGNDLDGFIIFDLIIAAAMIGLGFYLNSKLTPEFSKSKELYQNDQGEDRMRYVIKFKD